MTHLQKNYSNQDPACENGDDFTHCNLSQAEPDTVICAGKTGLVFVECNLSNCNVPGDAVVTKCLIVQANRDAVVEEIETDIPGIGTLEVRRNVIVGRGVQ